MHVYLPEKYRSSFSSWSLPFLKSLSLGSKLRWSFRSCLLESCLVILTSRKDLISSYFFVLHPLSQGLSILPDIFLRKGIMEQALPGVFDCPPTWSCPQVFNSVWGWDYVKEGLTRRCFHAEILEFQSYSRHRNYFYINSKQTHSEEIQVIPMERFSEVMKTFCFAFGENIKWHLVGQEVQTSIWGLQRIDFQNIHFICMNNDLVRIRKHCLPI